MSRVFDCTTKAGWSKDMTPEVVASFAKLIRDDLWPGDVFLCRDAETGLDVTLHFTGTNEFVARCEGIERNLGTPEWWKQ